MIDKFNDLNKLLDHSLNQVSQTDNNIYDETYDQELAKTINSVVSSLSEGLKEGGFLQNVEQKDREKLYTKLHELEIGCSKRVHDITKKTFTKDASKASHFIANSNELSKSIHRLEKSDVVQTHKKAKDVLLESFKTRNIESDSPSAKRSLMIAKHIDSYVDKLIPKMMEKIEKEKGPLKDEIRVQYEKELVKKLEKVNVFFGTAESVSGKEARGVRSISPIERVTATLDQLEKGEIADAFESAVSVFVEKLIQRAFDQHYDNPEQFVSHGFDHSLNVADYTKSIYENNPAIVKNMSKKYKFSEGEAKAALELLALLHDCGYPVLGDKAKVVHGISGADIVETMREEMSQIFVSKEMRREHFHSDFFHAVMFHSADKVEKHYGSKIETNLGSFLVQPDNIVKVLSTFKDPKANPLGVSRYATVIYVNDESMQKTIQDELKKMREHELDHLPKGDHEKLPPVPKVEVEKKGFDGRQADLLDKKDRLIGIEFEETDVLETPLSMIRLADNMDMRANRMSAIQREEAFREFYHVLGDGPVSQGFLELNAIATQFSSKKEVTLLAVAKEKMKELEKVLENYPPLLDWDNRMKQMKSPEDVVTLYKMRVIEGILAKSQYKTLPDSLKDEIRSIGVKLSDYDLRHFGGCEAIIDVQVVMLKEVPVVQISVDNDNFESLNKIRVNESIQDEYGKTLQVEVGVGEYQIWRAADAFKSVRLGNERVLLKIVDQKGQLIKSTFNKDWI